MEYFVYGIVAGFIATILLVIWATKGEEWHNVFAAVTAAIVAFITIVTIIAFCVTGYEWKAAEYKVQIINKKYGTEYSQEEYFYGKDTLSAIYGTNFEPQVTNGEASK